MLSIENTALLVVDIQGKLASLMHEKDKLYRNLQRIIQAAKILDIPILWTEQVPEKIGQTVPDVAGLLTDSKPIIKKSFSCCGSKEFVKTLSTLKRNQILIAGIETHVCVYQTVAELIDLSYYVQVVGDAVSSRCADDKHAGLERIKAVGGTLTSVETVACELIKTSEHPRFKEILSILKGTR
jgi:nicotinamidase-related amidase